MDFKYEDEYVKKHLSKQAIWGQLFEELGEMQHHAIKIQRILDRENPTPCNLNDEMLECEKEWNDVLNCVRLLDIHHDETEMKCKMIRWWHRLKQKVEGS